MPSQTLTHCVVDAGRIIAFCSRVIVPGCEVNGRPLDFARRTVNVESNMWLDKWMEGGRRLSIAEPTQHQVTTEPFDINALSDLRARSDSGSTFAHHSTDKPTHLLTISARDVLPFDASANVVIVNLVSKTSAMAPDMNMLLQLPSFTIHARSAVIR